MGYLWSRLVWSFKIGFEGVHPARDPDGRAWPAGTTEESEGANKKPLFITKPYFMVVLVVTGDLDFYSNDLGAAHHGTVDRPCLQPST
eukprot:13160169-Alexandrium_andersonii.AAC.1